MAPLWKPWLSESPMVTSRCRGRPRRSTSTSMPSVGSVTGTRPGSAARARTASGVPVGTSSSLCPPTSSTSTNSASAPNCAADSAWHSRPESAKTGASRRLAWPSPSARPRDGAGPPGPAPTVSREVVGMVTRFDPFRDLDALASQLLNQASDMGQAMRAMPIDLFRSGDHYVLLCDLPGVDPGSVDVGVDGRVLTIRGQRSARGEDVEWLSRERPTGTFVRQLTLGPGLDLDRIEAAYNDGVLSLTLPVAEQAKPRRIEVAHGSERAGVEGAAGQQTISGTATESTAKSTENAS